MIQDNQYTFNHNNLEIELTIKSYTSSEKGLEFFLPKLFPNCKCESCGRSLSGINYLRYMHNRNTKNEKLLKNLKRNICYNLMIYDSLLLQ